MAAAELAAWERYFIYFLNLPFFFVAPVLMGLIASIGYTFVQFHYG